MPPTLLRLSILAVFLILGAGLGCSGGDKDSPEVTGPGTIRVGQKPWSVALDEGRGLLYAANEFENTVAVVDLQSRGVISTISTPNPVSIAVNTATGAVFAANAFVDQVTVIQDSEARATIAVGRQPWDVVVDPVANLAYVANSEGDTVSVIDGDTLEVTRTLDGFSEPYGLALSADGSMLYVSNAATNEVVAVDAVTGSVLQTGAVGGRPRGLAVAEDDGRLYVANSEGASVSVLSLTDLSLIATISVGLEPLAVAVNPALDAAYAVNSFGDTMSVIDTAANALVATVPAGSKPWDVVVSADGLYIYVASSGSGEITIFSADRVDQAD